MSSGDCCCFRDVAEVIPSLYNSHVSAVSDNVILQAGTATAAGGAQEAADIARLARALVAAYERNGRAFQGSKASDWKLRAMMADDSFFSNASDWTFGGPGGSF